MCVCSDSVEVFVDYEFAYTYIDSFFLIFPFREVGKNLVVPGGAKVIDAQKKLVMPGNNVVFCTENLPLLFVLPRFTEDSYKTFTCPPYYRKLTLYKINMNR